jgi:hypothetical protein
VNNYFAPDGYRYGVMFGDGSIRTRWNGRTQRERAEEEAAALAVTYYPDTYVVVRRALGGEWQRCPDPARPEPLPGA